MVGAADGVDGDSVSPFDPITTMSVCISTTVSPRAAAIKERMAGFICDERVLRE